MKIAVVFHVPSPGGLTRFTHALIDGLVQADESLSIDYYVAEQLLAAGRVPAFSDPDRVRLVPLRDPQVVDSNLGERSRFVQWLNIKLSSHPRLHTATREAYLAVWPLMARIRTGRRAKHWYQFAFTPDVLAAFAAYDVVYLPFPYYIEPADVEAAVVGTFHDVNHKHFTANFQPRLLRQMDRQIHFWTRRADAVVVSTRFIREDLLHFYPGAAERCSIVYVPPYNIRPVTELERSSALGRFGLDDAAFLLYPSNQAYHKNILGLVIAADLMKRQNGKLDYPIVFTGFGTDKLGSRKVRSLSEVDAYLASSSLQVGRDVMGLGFVSDEEVDGLTRSARMVVSTSFYEAGCGPALDAWQFGVPVAFSNIPAFVEQLAALGVEAWVFDPADPEEIARVLSNALANREESLAMAARSKEAIAGHTWPLAAQEYLKVFARAIEHRRSGELPRGPISGGDEADADRRTLRAQ